MTRNPRSRRTPCRSFVLFVIVRNPERVSRMNAPCVQVVHLFNFIHDRPRICVRMHLRSDGPHRISRLYNVFHRLSLRGRWTTPPMRAQTNPERPTNRVKHQPRRASSPPHRFGAHETLTVLQSTHPRTCVLCTVYMRTHVLSTETRTFVCNKGYPWYTGASKGNGGITR